MGRIPSRGSDQFVVRFPPGLRDRIKSHAELRGRSMNAEIIIRLEESFMFDDQDDAWYIHNNRIEEVEEEKNDKSGDASISNEGRLNLVRKIEGGIEMLRRDLALLRRDLK